MTSRSLVTYAAALLTLSVAPAFAQQSTAPGQSAQTPPPVTNQTPVVNPNSTRMTPHTSTTNTPLTAEQLKAERKARRTRRSTSAHTHSHKLHAGASHTQEKQDQTRPATPPSSESPQ